MYKYFLFLSILLFLLIVKFHIAIVNYLGEKLFLDWHQNNLAIFVLELPQSKNDKTHFLLGRLYFVENALEKSIDNYNSAIKRNPNEKEYYYGRGLSYGYAGSNFYLNAENDFKKYIEIDKEEKEETGQHAWGAWAGYNDLAWIYFMQEKYEDAEKVTRAGLKISDLNPWLLNMLGATLLEKGDCKEGKIALENAKIILESITSKQFGEAYSGDKPDFWEIGKKQMTQTINENLKLCNTFPQ